MVLLIAGLTTGVRADGVEAWGYDGTGQLGDNATSPRPAPITWGGNGFTSGVSAVAAGSGFSLVVKNGSLYAAGDNAYGQLGDGGTIATGIPKRITTLSNVKSVAAGSSFSLAVVQSGQLYAWGNNAYGSVGDNSTTQRNTPTRITGLTHVSAIAAGQHHSLAVQNGGVYAWGQNIFGQLGDGGVSQGQSNAPVRIDATHLTNVTAVAGGTYHSLALQNGAVWAWGANLYGELGDGTRIQRYVPITVGTLTSGVTSIAAGSYFSLAVQDGNVWAWGVNTMNQLGDGTTTERDSPVEIDTADLHDIVAVAAGNASSYALRADGTLWVWGSNANNALGLNSDTTLFSSPQELAPPPGYVFTSISAARLGTHALATLAPVPEPSSLALLTLAAPLLLRRSRNTARRGRGS